ncbi:iron complex outermembrane receptor protein [Methylorubrum rhodinum]|uniref:Iron complex outermembrane receptor protein n=1 Tax=Methylorubrum rhodinum TaxID=29428 RepID=A0A840ZHW3_9HYPH|nr:TonB-dependent siderophore receptor [Methylorubrum rhodinum]MBB5756591.1 iron complex outermembrane receptor protein [Methylorubrum rhodinum]
MSVLSAGSAALLGAVGLAAPLGALAQESTRLDEISVSAEGRGPVRPGAGIRAPGRANVVSVSGDPEAGGKGPVDGFVARTSTAGSKTATPIVETPQSLTVIGRDRIEVQQATSASEVFQYTPGVNADTYGSNSRSDNYILIRGLPANFFQDNLRLPLTRPYGGYRVDPYTVERIEILRGPSSVLYGQGGPGGTINYVSKRPTPVPFAMVDMLVGNFEQPRIGVDFGGALNNDGTLSYRMVGVGQNSQLNGGNPFTGQRIALAPSLAWKPDNQTSLILFGSVLQDDTHIDSDFYPARGTVLPNPFGRIQRNFWTGNRDFDKQIRTQYAIGYEFEHRFSDNLAFRQNMRYASVTTSINTVYGAGIPRFDIFDTAENNFNAKRNLLRNAIGGKNGAATFTVDNQLQFDFLVGPTKHTVLAGVDYLNQYSFDRQDFRSGGVLDLVTGIGQPIAPGLPLLIRNEKQNISQVGVYIQDQIKIFDKLVLTAGARYDSATSDYSDRVSYGTNVAFTTDSALSPRIGLVYLLDNGLAPYISYSESFSVNPGAASSQGVGGALIQGAPFEPSLGRQKEVGIRYQSPDLPILLSAAAFDITQTNVVSTFNFTSFAEDQRSKGFELEALVDLGNGFRMIGSYTLQDVRIINDPSLTGLSTRPTAVPDRIGSIWGDYTFLTGDLRGLRLAAGLRYNGSSFGGFDQTTGIPGDPVTGAGGVVFDTPIRVKENFLVDAAISYAYENWRFSLNVRNLADRKYITACSDPTSCFYGQERKVILGARYTW